MLKIKNNNVEEKYSEINIKHRLFEDKSIITINIGLEFFPKLIGESIISGKADIKIDLSDIDSIDSLSNKKYQGNIGYITISVNNNGIWENIGFDNFEVEFKKIKDNKIRTILTSDNISFDTYITIVSLYTSRKDIDKYFKLDNFYKQPIINKIGNKEVFKYYFNK